MGSIHYEHSKEVARGSVFGLVGTIFAKLVSFVYIIYVARVFSQADIGLFYLSLSVITVLGVWRDFGLSASISRYIPYYEGKGEWRKAIELLRTSYAITLVSGAVLSAAFWLFSDPIAAFYSNPGLGEGLRLLSIYALLSNIFSVTTSYLQSRRDIYANQLINNVQNTVKLVLTVALFYLYGASLFTLSASFVLSFAVAAAFSIPFMKRRVEDLPKGGEGLPLSAFWREIVPFGIMLTVIQTLWVIVSACDRLLLGYMGGAAGTNEMIGIYSLAVQLAATMMVFPGAIGGIFLPVISRLIGREDHSAVRSVMETSHRWMLFITIPVAVVMIAFSSEMLVGFYGRDYAAGAATLSIFVVGLLFSVLTYTVSLALAGRRLIRIELLVAAVASILNVVLNVLLIPSFGLEGAASASALSFLASALLLNHYGKKFLQFGMPRETYRLLLAGAATLAIIFFLKPALPNFVSFAPAIGSGEMQHYFSKFAYMALVGLMTCLAVALFGIFSLLAKTFKSEDIAVMQAAARKARVPEPLVELAGKIASFGVAAG